MKETWRWFGPLDKITLPQIAQTGASGIVNALHEIPYGEAWPTEAIAERKAMITAAGLTWDVVESLPVHEDIKRGAGDLDTLFANYRQSMANLAAHGVTVICYNFMPLLDWTRTRLDAPLPMGGHALRFSAPEMAYFDIHMLKRDGAEADWSEDVRAKAKALADKADEDERARLMQAIMAGLPGAYARYDVTTLREALAPWHGFGRADLAASLKRFLSEVIPAAEDLGMKLAIHQDDPPRPLLGLPRIVSNEDDLAALLDMVDSPANGLTFCTGSLGANPANDVAALARRFAGRVHFAHLRNVAKEPDGSFQESAHLDGDNDMPAIIAALLQTEAERGIDLPFRPDHGHALLHDLEAGAHPGYPLIGRLRGLAELRGVIAGLGHRLSA